MEPERKRVRISGADRRKLRAAVTGAGVDLCYGSGSPSPEGFAIEGILPAARLSEARAALQGAGLRIEDLGAVDVTPREVARSDRFSRRGRVPRGVGSKE